MYSLVSPSVLCMDLIRHDNAIGILDVLDRAVLLGPDGIAGLEAVHRDDPARDAAWAEVDRLCGLAPRMTDAVAAVQARMAEGGVANLAGHGLADRLARTPMFGLPHLLTMVRHDVLDWTWHRDGDLSVQHHPDAVAVVVDAVAAAYARSELSVQAYARLGGPWAQLHRERPSALPAADVFGPQSPALRELVDRLARTGPDDFARLERAANDARTAGVEWSRTMHGATWAAYLSGRLRPAARAQFAATRSLALAGLDPVTAAAGVMRAVTAVVQALVVADLLDSVTYEQLVGPWRTVHGDPA